MLKRLQNKKNIRHSPISPPYLVETTFDDSSVYHLNDVSLSVDDVDWRPQLLITQPQVLITAKRQPGRTNKIRPTL